MRLKVVPVTTIFATCLMLSIGLSSGQAESVKPAPPALSNFALGERMYREGILPSGEPMHAFVKKDLPVSGTAFSCVSCHLRSGLGSFEGGVITPPTNGAKLYNSAQFNYKNIQQKYFPTPPRRPAYDDKSLAEVIRSGENPEKVVLNDVMPRYMLEDEDMDILVAYLKSLSKDYSPGVTDKTIHFATVIADDVRPEVRDALLAPLQKYIDNKNSQAEFYESPRGSRSRLMVENMLASRELATRRLTLSRWVLKGPPESWRTQLDEYYRKEPVFALLGGATNREWQVIHNFSEDNKIPTLMPQTDFPVISATTGWYTIYPSRGYFQEGESTARYLASREDISSTRPIVQIVRESLEGKALSAGFDKTWQDMDRSAVLTVRLKADEKITSSFLERLLDKEKPSVLVLWDGPEVQSALDLISTARNRPELVFISSRYLGNSLRTIPERVREFTYITYPFSFAQKTIVSPMGKTTVEDDSKWNISLQDFPEQNSSLNATNLSNSITQILTMALMEMRGNYYRDNFFDVIGMVPDQPSALYARLSFGPDQRYASKGCYIVQLTSGSKPEIIRKSDWVIH
jgi:hypothetical protein